MKAITEVTIIDGTGDEPIPEGVILIDEDGKIVDCGGIEEVDILDGAEVKDFPGCTVMPGLIDAHVHLGLKPVADPIGKLKDEPPARTAARMLKHARRTIEAGVTAVRDMGCKDFADVAVKNSIEAGEHPGPEILASGHNLAMTGGHGWPMGEEVDGEHEARRGARRQIKHGADQIKLMATGGILTEGVEPGAAQLTEEEMRAAIEEAHKAGRRAAAHAQGSRGIKNAIRAGIDSIEHGIYLTEEIIEMMMAEDVFLVPTLSASHWILEKGEKAGIPAHAVEKMEDANESHLRSFRMACSSGVKIAMGTDAGTPFNEHGANSQELKFMVQEGMQAMEAVKSATSRAAELLGVEDEMGTIKPGKRADLLLLSGNPLEDIENIDKVEKVFLSGRSYLPGEAEDTG